MILLNDAQVEKGQLATERDYLHNQLESCYESIKEKEVRCQYTIRFLSFKAVYLPNLSP